MAIVSAGIFSDTPAARLANDVCYRLGQVIGEYMYVPGEYEILLGFRTYEPGGLGGEVAGTGIRPGALSRKYREFTILIEVPPNLADEHAYNEWMASCLSEAATIVRRHVPRKSKEWPAERLAEELDRLREQWMTNIGGG